MITIIISSLMEASPAWVIGYFLIFNITAKQNEVVHHNAKTSY